MEKYKYFEKYFGLKNKKIIITGCSGQLGEKMVDTFLNFGCTVIGLDNKKSRLNLFKKINNKSTFFYISFFA